MPAVGRDPARFERVGAGRRELAMFAVRSASTGIRRPTAPPTIAPAEAEALAATFKALACGTRLRLLHALARTGPLRVMDLAAALAMRPQAVCNQLRRLVDGGFVAADRDGGRIRYRIADPCVSHLLVRGLCLTRDSRRRRRT